MKIIGIDGSPGVGKTTTCRELAALLGNSTTVVAYEMIPATLLDYFFHNPKTNPLAIQKGILFDRFIQHISAIQKGFNEKLNYVIIDRTLKGDDCYARANILDEGMKAEYEKYLADNKMLEKEYSYDVRFYITAGFKTIVKRIKRRDRTVEKDVNESYWEKIHKKHEEIFENDKGTIRIDNSKIDGPDTAFEIYKRIMKLEGKEVTKDDA